MSILNALRSTIGWVAERNMSSRELIKFLKAERLKRVSRRRNARFVLAHPNEPLPPLDLMVDAHAHADYEEYFVSGRRHARLFLDMFNRHFDLGRQPPVRMFEWGCGPGRILRHMHADCSARTVSLLAGDYNAKSIDWCRRAFPDIEFFVNGVAPPLPLPSTSIDITYARSCLRT